MSMVLQNWKMLGRLYRKGCSANRHFCSRAVQTAKKYEAGQCIHGYRVKKVEPIPELYLTAVKLEHEGTAAQHIHIAREDRNNVFSVGLRTTPLDSTGVPHILEHTTLCGSEKFPCRDPFFKMLTRSLSTFMNAFTASDWTMYPFSTQNAQDFENLLSVYLDAVFYPQLRELDFMQEGWRLEHQVVNDHGSPIVFKGVVFNEMKGAFASPEQVYAQHLQNSLYPSHTYSHVSGGQPLSIPDLTWEKLRQFHAAHYHPSNARFYTYGNLPLERHLELIDSLVLSRFTRVNTDTSVPDQQRWSKPRTVTVNCAPDNMAPNPERQTAVSVSYLLSGITDTFEDCTLSIIGSLLTSGPTSPFYQSLIEPGIGADFSPSTGYSGDLKEGAFSIGLQGIAEDDVPIVEDIIRETFDKVIEEGFPQERIDALLHNIELSLRHQTSNFGLGLAVSIAAVWNHDGSALDALKVTKNVEKFKQHVKEDPKFLQNKVKQYFKENTHKLNLIMVPKEKYKLEVEKKEDEKLQQMVSILTDDEKQKIYNKGLELAEKQNEPEDLSCLPTLRISDIEKRGEFIQVSHSTPLNVPVQLCEQPTNGVTYFKAVADASNLDTALLPYLPIFCNVLAQMGAGQMDFRELSQEIQLKTGGMSAASLVTNSHTDPLSYEQGILFSSYCLDRNTSDMFSIWSEIFNGVKLTAIDRLSTLVKMAANELAMSVAQSGHSYAMTHASSFLTPAAHMKERLGGISQVRHMKQIAEMQDGSPVLEKLALIAKQLLNKNSIRCSINASPEHAQKSVNHLETFLASLSGSSRGAGRILIQKSDFTATCEKTHVELPFPVNYVSKCLETVPYTHPDSAVLSVLATLLKWKYLHKEIREKGGAYGGGANMGGGLLTYYSYRDPHVMQTLEQFDKSADWARSGQFSDSDVNEAKLFVFQGVDGPISPGEKGVDLFLQALTDEAKQVHREQFFDVQKNDIIQAAHRYLTPGNRPSAITFIGPENPATVTDSSWVRVSETESSDMPSQQGVV